MAHRENDLVLESYGGGALTTPVIVKELLLSLSGAEISKTSVGIDCEKSSGWIWIVYARSVYVWNFKDRVLNCYELPLPSSGLIHSARLCYVFPRLDDDLTKPPSCVCVSPEGCVRYWPKISQSSSYIDYNIELSGQVGHSVTPLKGKAFQQAVILATTTCNAFLLSMSDGRSKREQPIQCIPLKAPQNLISGIGRRMSSLIFATSLSNASSQEALVNIATVAKKGAPESNLLYVMNTKCLVQWWQVEPFEQNKFLWEMDLRQDIMEKLASEIWNVKAADIHSHPKMNCWAVDFVVTARRRFAILVAIHDPGMSPYVHYAVAFFNEPDPNSRVTFDVFRLPFTRTYEPRLEEAESQDLRLFCPFSYEGVFVHDTAVASVSHENEKKVSSLTVAEGDQILGSGVNGDQFLLFTFENGLQTTKILSGRTGLPFLAEMGDQRVELHQTRKSQEELEEMARDEDRGVQLKAAFIYFLKQKLPECEEAVDAILEEQTDDLDNLLVGLAIDVVDDYPASDPRWVQAIGAQGDQGGMTTRQKSRGRRTEGGSLLLNYQLDDKRKTYELFISFLKSMKLKDRLRNYRTPEGRSASTVARLCELGEKLEACAAFVRKTEDAPKSFDHLLRDSMAKVLKARDEHIGHALGVQDVFYRKISDFHQLLPAFTDEGLRAIDKLQRQHEDDAQYAYDQFVRMADCILTILSTAAKYRRVFERTMQWQKPADLRTWLNAEMARSALAGFYCRMTKFMSNIIETPGDDLVVAVQCRDLADLILAECSIAPDRRLFEVDTRRKLIGALVQAQKFDHARSLAEKYHDFGLLIEICEKLKDDAALDTYKTKFREEGFLDVLYDYYILSKKPGKIFQQNLEPGSEIAALTARYLDSRRRTDLKWILNVKMNDFEKAGNNMLNLANHEEESLEAKKTMLSLAKLAALASDHPEESACLKHASEGLITVEHQLNMPSVADGPPLTAERLIEICISNPAADEWSFARAIDLLTSVCASQLPRADFTAMRAHVWASAILKDDWPEILGRSEDPLEATSGTVFSRTLQLLCNSLKGQPEKLIDQLATSEELLQSEDLQEWAQDPKFQYALRAGEERVHAWIAKESAAGDQVLVGDNEDDSMVME